jgi:hypothetical protein
MTKTELLQYIDEVISVAPMVVMYMTPAYKTQEYFLARLNGLVNGVYSGNLAGEFIDVMANLISGQLLDAYQTAYTNEGFSGELPDYLNASYQNMTATQYGYVDAFYRAIVDARFDKTPITPLLARAELWAQRWTEGYNEAVRLITTNEGGNLIWTLGATEEHCPECSRLNGIVARAKEWDVLNIRPQSAPNDKLTCGGWRCDCSLTPTDKRRSPNAYGRIEEIILSK